MRARLFFHALCCLFLLAGVAASSFYAWSPYSDEKREAGSGGGSGIRGSGPTHK
ncbi:hypothetical protein [Novosphingobium clariflavum]|uniref:Transmembrane protein n=1 Tax=Novosphingobium clariflavum TaxID=2029884 RepID=A0ABV6S3L2_9SPHN|nr:hypothetical protein [Novosphingobium clariflavum]